MASKILSSRPVVNLPFNALNNSKRKRVAIGHYTNTFNNAKIIATIYRHYLTSSTSHGDNSNTSSKNTSHSANKSVCLSHSIDKTTMKNNIGTALIISLVKNIESVYPTLNLSPNVISGSVYSGSSVSWHDSNRYVVAHSKLVKFLKGCVLRFKVSYIDLDKISLSILGFLKNHSKIFVEKLHNNIYKLVLGSVFTVLGSKIDKKLIGVNNPFLPGGVEELQTIANIMRVSSFSSASASAFSFWSSSTKFSTPITNSSSFNKKVIDRNMNHRHYVS
ncbi:hypothetical protein ACO0QE_002564 [Hanseniaspora vineae]